MERVGYIVESDFMHKGFRCVVIMTEMGHRCGYVGVTKKHRLYGVGYATEVKFLKTKRIPDIEIKEAGLGQILAAIFGKYKQRYATPEMYFKVHGGITYSGEGYPIDSEGIWWFGYDCAHCDDAKDLTQCNEKFRIIWLEIPDRGIIRTKEYCEDECRKLADQFNNVWKPEVYS